MMARLLDELKKLIPRGGNGFDPATLGDPVALKTEWHPIKGGGTNVRTHNLTAIDGGRMAFKPAVGLILFAAVFAVMGIGMMLLMLFAPSKGAPPPPVVAVLVGVVFTGAGFLILYFGGKPVIFDRAAGTVWKGWRMPREDYERGADKGGILCRLGDVHALQIVSERCRSKNSSYLSYELNLVLADGTRVNVVDHGDPVRLRADAAKLGEYLEAEVWDSTR